MKIFSSRPVPSGSVGWLITLLLSLLCLGGCRQFDRTQLAFGELVRLPEERKTLAEFERLAGANPQLGALWMQTIYVNPERELLEPAQAFENAQRARGFLPSAVELSLAEADWAARAEDIAAARVPLEAALQAGPDERSDVLLRSRLVEVLLEIGLPEAAREHCLRLSGASSSVPQQRAWAWAGVALAFELLGERVAADDAMERSLEQHQAGLERLAEAIIRRPEQGAAARALRTRAAIAFTWHPDVQLQRVGDQLTAGEIDAADERLEQLPAKIPERLYGARAVLKSRVHSLRGESEAAAAILLDYLHQRPDDLLALQALVLLWEEHQQPSSRRVLKSIYDFINFEHLNPLPTELRRGLIQMYERIRKAEQAEATEPTEDIEP